MIYIVTRNDLGERKEYNFEFVDEMMTEWLSENSSMDEYEQVLLVMKDNIALYCSIGKKESEQVELGDVVSWFNY